MMEEKEEIKKQIATLKMIIEGITEREEFKNSPEYQKLVDKYLDEISRLLKKLEE